MIHNSKIVFIMPWHISERGGGAEVQANYLAQELGKRQFQVDYICQTADDYKINKTQKIDNINIHWLKSSGRFHWLDQNKYKSKLKSIQPKYIVQRLSSNVSYVIGKYCRNNTCKFIWICTDNLSPYKNYHVLKFKKNNSIASIGALKFQLFLKNAQIMDWFRNKGMKQVDVAFTQNNIQYHILKQAFDIDSQRMISGHPFPKNISEPKNNFSKRTIIWCGNFGKNKRPTLFVKLANILKDKDYKFIMIGSHSDKLYVNEILKNKTNNLEVTGQLSFDKSLEFFSKASLLINTSVSEGFSNTYIQAWLRGVPTLVFGADPDNVISNNNLGYIAQNELQAAKFIDELFMDLEKYKVKCLNAKKFALNHYTIDRMTDSFLEAIGT